MTTRDFARKLGVEHAFAGAMLRGDRLPSDVMLRRFAKRLGIPVRDLVLPRYWDTSPQLRQGFWELGIVPEILRAK